MIILPFAAIMRRHLHFAFSPLRLTTLFTTLLCALLNGQCAARAATLTVSAGGNLQAAINNAQPGDTIIVEAGATFIGPIMLPKKNGDAWITIQSSRAAELPEGQRVSPTLSSLMPKIVTPGSGHRAMETEAGAHHYRLIGLEVTQQNSAAFAYDLMTLGDGSSAQRTLDQVAHHLVVDRCYIHGDATAGIKRGIALNSAHTEIINSYISDCKGRGYDTQAIAGWNGPGPFKIINNYLEAAGENVLFGGSDAQIQGLVPTDIELRRNHLRKPPEWQGVWTVKNLFELKNARRVVVDGNIFENNWTDGQNGTAVLFTVRNQDGTNPWAVIEDVRFTNNIVRNTIGVFNVLGTDYTHPSRETKDITIMNNLVDQASGHFMIISGGSNIKVMHNTVLHAGNITNSYAEATQGFVFTDNIMRHNAYGVFSGLSGVPGSRSLDAGFPGAVFTRNVLIGPVDTNYAYPDGNYLYPLSADIGFVDHAAGNYRLQSGSAYKGRGADGTDIGVDYQALEAALAGQVPVQPTPTPTPTPAPTLTPEGQTPYLNSPAAVPGQIEAENYDRGNESVAYHDADAINHGGQYRTAEGVDIQQSSDGGSYLVGWMRAGEWLEYTVDVGASGMYTIEARVASAGAGGGLHIEFDGIDKTGTLIMPNTGGWQTWQTITKTNVQLSGGRQVMRIALDSNGATGYVGNLDHIRVVAATNNAGDNGGGSGNGLSATYFDNLDFTDLRVTRTNQTVNFDWGGGSPDPASGVDTFSVRWSGQVEPRYTEAYTFYTTSDDGVRLWIDNQLLIDNWTDHGPTENTGTISLSAGQKYDLRMEFYEQGGEAAAKLS